MQLDMQCKKTECKNESRRFLDRKIKENDNQTQANIFDGHRVFCDDHDII